MFSVCWSLSSGVYVLETKAYKKHMFVLLNINNIGREDDKPAFMLHLIIYNYLGDQSHQSKYFFRFWKTSTIFLIYKSSLFQILISEVHTKTWLKQQMYLKLRFAAPFPLRLIKKIDRQQCTFSYLCS